MKNLFVVAAFAALAFSTHVVGAETPPPSPVRRSAKPPETILFEGRFGPDGSNARVQMDIIWDEDIQVGPSLVFARSPTFHLLVDGCVGHSNHVAFTPTVQQPMAIVDLDGDGRDEAFLFIQGATVDAVTIVRVDGCHIACVRRPGERGCVDLSFSGRGVFDSGGVGVVCRRTPAGAIEILEVSNTPWTARDPIEENTETKTFDHVSWTRKTSVLRGKKLVTIAEDTGTTKIPDDPSVPLRNDFSCLGPTWQ